MSIIDRIIYGIIKLWNIGLRIQADPVRGIRLSVIYTNTASSIDDRLAKIDSARENLSEALLAIDELREQASESRKAVEMLNDSISGAEKEHKEAVGELETVKTLAALDIEVVRRALGVPTNHQRWIERIASFFLGVLASLAATVIWTTFT